MPSFNLCRICLTEDTDNDTMQPLFDEKNARCAEIVQKIEECGGIVLKAHEEYPKMICKTCLDSLNTSYKFRAMCQASENALLEAIVKSEMKIEPQEMASVTDAIRSATQSDIFFDLHTEFIDAEEVDFADIADAKEHDYVDVDGASPDYIIDSAECSDEDDNMDEDDSDEFVPITPKRKCAKKSKPVSNTKNRKNVMPVLCKAKKRGRPRLQKQLVEPSGSENEKDDTDYTPSIKKKQSRKQKNMSDDAPPNIMCEICGNIYSKQSLLNMHLRRHLATKPFECEICGKTFACPSEIRRHIRTHTGEKPYVCKFCGRTFADRSTNIKHERIHTNERPFSCKTCGKSFTYSNVLKNHMLVHTGEKPFACLPCSKTFSRKHQLDQHILTLTHQLTVRKMGTGEVAPDDHAGNDVVDEYLTVTAESAN